MKEKSVHFPPKRVTDLAELKKWGSEVTCQLTFDVLPVDFAHKENPFQAYIFLCRYTAFVRGEKAVFRKCYARGCPHNLCPHVSQAVMIANRYLQRDISKLREAGIVIEDGQFSLPDMVTKFEENQVDNEPALTIHDYINIATEGNTVRLAVSLELVSAVEHFAGDTNKQTFLTGYFSADTMGRKGRYQRCLACYPTEQEGREKPLAIVVANERLSELYEDFDNAGIDYQERFFEP